MPQFDHSCLLKVYKPTCQLCCFSDASVLCLPSVHTIVWSEIFFKCSTICLEQSPRFFKSFLKSHLQAVLLIVCVCVWHWFFAFQWAMCSKLEKWHTKEYVSNIIAPCSHYLLWPTLKAIAPWKLRWPTLITHCKCLLTIFKMGFWNT